MAWGLGARRAAALAGLLALTALEIQLILSAPPRLLPLIAGVTGVSLIGSLLVPWRWTLAVVAIWPLFINLPHSAALLVSAESEGMGALAAVSRWLGALPPYPMLPVLLAPVGIVWAWGALLGSRRSDPWPRDVIGRLAWLWGWVLMVGTLIGLSRLNPLLAEEFWSVLGSERWRWPLAGPLDSFHPLALGHAAAIVLLFFAAVRGRADSPERLRVLGGALVCAGGLIAVFTLISRGEPGVIRDPDLCGATLLAALVLSLSSPSLDVPLRGRQITVALVVFSALALLITLGLLAVGSRMSCLAAAVLLLGWQVRRLGRGNEALRPSPLAMALVGLWLAAMIWPPRAASPDVEPNLFFRGLESAIVWLRGDSESSLPTAWEASRPLIREHPWWGQGLGTLSLVSPEPALSRSPGPALHTWVEQGLVGLSVLLAIALVALTSHTAWSAPRWALLGFALVSLVSRAPLLVESQLILWLLVAMCAPALGREAALPGSHTALVRLLPGAALLLIVTGLMSVALAVSDRGERPTRIGVHGVFQPDSDGVPCVWTQRRALLPLDVESGSLVLRLRAGHPDAEEDPVGLTVRVDGQSVLTAELPDTRWRFWVLDLRPWIGQTVTLELEASRSWSPSDLGSPDHRALALALGPWEWLDDELEPDPPRAEPWLTPLLP
ncbi:hypothetical protein JXA47_07785 [Candidatus Sumerlaeota bacterium]|nr:hypothetical protein [Candidatus Sumerlaeota bacterium]